MAVIGHGPQSQPEREPPFGRGQRSLGVAALTEPNGVICTFIAPTAGQDGSRQLG